MEDNEVGETIRRMLRNNGDIYEISRLTESYFGNLTAFCRMDPETGMKLLERLSETDNLALINSLLIPMNILASRYSMRCLQIIKRWFCNDSLRNNIQFGMLPTISFSDEVGNFLTDWLSNEKNSSVLYQIPFLLDELIFSRNKEGLLELLSINLTNDRVLFLLLNSLKEVISHESEYNLQGISQGFADKSYDMICKIAELRGIDHSWIKRDNDKIAKICVIIDSVITQKRIDFDTVKRNLASYANIKFLLGDSLENVSDANCHPLIRMLSNAKIHSGTLAKIKSIDNALGAFLKEKQPKLKRIKDGLITPDEYYQTVDELLFAARFKADYVTEMQYPIADRRADCYVDINGTKILVELISLDIADKMKRPTSMVELNSNRLRWKILEKIQDRERKRAQIAVYAEYAPFPIFLAINTTRSLDMDESDLYSVLYGTSQITIDYDSEGRPLKIYTARIDDFISKEDNWKHVSGLILYKECFDSKDGKMKFCGDIYKNDLGRVVSDEIIQKMKHVLFDRSLQ